MRPETGKVSSLKSQTYVRKATRFRVRFLLSLETGAAAARSTHESCMTGSGERTNARGSASLAAHVFGPILKHSKRQNP